MEGPDKDMDLLSLVPIGQLTAPALLALAFLLLMRGDLVTRKVHEEAVSYFKEALTLEREAHKRSQSALNILLVEHGTTTEKVLNALPSPAGGDEE